MTKLVKRLGAVMLTAGAFVLAVGMGIPGAAKAGVPESSDPIKLALNEWTGQHISTGVAGEILKRMGYNVDYVTAGYIPQMDALMDGTVTATLEIWELTIGEHYDRVMKSGKVDDLGDNGIVTREGWVYPGFAEEVCPGLPDWRALENCAEVFATPETFPKGRVIDYPADWGSISVQKTETFGLADKYTNIPYGSEGSAVAEMKSAFERKSPILVMFWQPHWVFGEMDMRWVDFPPYEPGCDSDPALGEWPDKTDDCAWASGWVKKVVWSGMKDKWPVAYEFLKVYQSNNDIQAELIKEIDVNGRDLVEVCKEWVDANESVWQPWVDEAMKAAQ